MSSYTETRKSAAPCTRPSSVADMPTPKLETSEHVADSSQVKRLTLDLSKAEHRALKLISVERDIPMAELLRGAIAELQRDDDLLERVSRHAS